MLCCNDFNTFRTISSNLFDYFCILNFFLRILYISTYIFYYILTCMNKNNAFLFITMLSLFFFSCKREPQYRIGVSQCSDDDWRKLMNEEIEREIMFYPEASVEIRAASDNSARQIEDIRYFIDNNFDMIIAAPNEADSLTPIIEEAYDKGIPVLLFDRGIHGNSFTAFQGADNEEIGKQAAIYAHKLLPNGGKIIELRGLSGSTPALGRGQGFKNGIDSLNNMLEIVASQDAAWNYEVAMKVADSLLDLHPDVDLIYAHNDRMALGAADISEKKGLHPKIIGIDAAPHIGMKAVDDGELDATFLYPTEGHQLIRTSMAILKGEPYDSILLIPASPAVDRSNVDILLMQARQLNEETARMKQLKEEVDSYWEEHSNQTALLYAAIAILLLVCILLFSLLRNFWQQRRHKEELLEKNRQLEEQRDLQKQLNIQLASATQSKLVFFTNVSHELRTPLTLIAEPVDQISKASNLTQSQKLLLGIANKNIQILKRLIDQILDFRKFENDKLTLNLEEYPISVYAREWTDAFRPLASRRHIDYEVNVTLPDNFTLALDIEKLERVIFNLLSNAFKYTPIKGKIIFSISIADDKLEIRVADTGRGIEAANLKDIFTRFYQVDKVRPQGSGIGLNLAKAFVELHDGTISVESEIDKGTVFTVLIPIRHVAREASEGTFLLSSEAAKEAARVTENIDHLIEEQNEESSSDKPLVLVIDDNEDIRVLVTQLLKDQYKVISASGGNEGIRMATRYVPDAIICDVMMPDLDGMQTCAAIKNEVSTSHIPVLMLTACSLDEQKVEGYENGADGYMSKPFNNEVLRARVASLITNRKRIREYIGNDRISANGNPSEDNGGKSKATDIENEFFSRLKNIIRKEIGNMDLSVDLLADKMGMGRSQFYRKIKALTGLSPVELLRDMRLKKARELLLTTDKSVSEIAYDVGFSTPAYFTKCYREVYSETPSALRERTRKQ